ncbi:hypothetical protein DES53_107340 [Roseimicrobium gellanilyticum]|uniref:Uncharacterized protein n=1 Tax=Roseimicrobium gellanilyticum TaxID=748857 RepID=A0A366HG50_9BACT|nr:hypothetical protein [Roseimicrobium gellanilyticum]RBP41507.1 hypothetical protein DES53_107340 [Roseimicrobium gellanilyticum]
MNSKQKSMQHLLDDVVTPESDCEHLGPNRTTLLEMVSQERARRKRTSTYLGTAAGACVCALVTLLLVQQSHWFQESPATPSTVHAVPAPPEPITIHEVNDKELLELLKDTPVALMEWPDGKHTLLVMER